MITRHESGPGQGHDDPGLSAVMSERRQLVNLCYRLLGSLADAEDVVQETYLRWYRLTDEERATVESPGGWLTTVASRICLDLLRSARARRERYVGPWIPEPLPDGGEWISVRPGESTAADPVDRVTLDESVNMAFLVVLDSLTPAERVAFVLHDVFGYTFPEVAKIVGRTPAACRQLAASARRRIRARSHAHEAPTRERLEVVRDFKQAWDARDIPALVELLDPDVVAVADGGGVVSAALQPILGRDAVTRTVIDISELAPDLTLHERTVNGEPGLVAEQYGAIVTVFAFDVVGQRIKTIWAVRNPEKLRRWTAG